MYGTVEGFKGRGRLVAATDAGYKGKAAGIAFVVSDGRWGLRTWRRTPRLDPSGPSGVLVAELRAVALLCEAPGGRLPPELLVDSVNAIRFLRAWQSGDTDSMPSGYSLRPRCGHPTGQPTLVRLARIMAAHPGLRIGHVRGHTGHPLNEAADSLASIGRRGAPAAETRARATGQVEAFLPIWHSQYGRTASRAGKDHARQAAVPSTPLVMSPPRSLSRPSRSARRAARRTSGWRRRPTASPARCPGREREV